MVGSQCHTNDRLNMRAQRDGCGIGPGKVLDNAISKMFAVNYHSFVQDPGVTQCINDVFDDSLQNQMLTWAAPLLKTATTFIALITMIGV